MPKSFKQRIRHVQGSTALVESAKGNVYPVIISDRVRLSSKFPQAGDIGIVHRVNGKYYLYDFEPKPDETDSYLSETPIEDIIGEY